MTDRRHSDSSVIAMRDAPPSAGEAYATRGLIAATAGGAGMVAAAVLGWPASVMAGAAVLAFVGFLTFEMARRFWMP